MHYILDVKLHMPLSWSKFSALSTSTTLFWSLENGDSVIFLFIAEDARDPESLQFVWKVLRLETSFHLARNSRRLNLCIKWQCVNPTFVPPDIFGSCFFFFGTGLVANRFLLRQLRYYKWITQRKTISLLLGADRDLLSTWLITEVDCVARIVCGRGAPG
jgi:hypothetical protein